MKNCLFALHLLLISASLSAQERGYPPVVPGDNATSVTIRVVQLRDTSKHEYYELHFDENKNITAELYLVGADKKPGDCYYYTYGRNNQKASELYYGIPHRYGNGLDTTIERHTRYFYNRSGKLVRQVDSTRYRPLKLFTHISQTSFAYDANGILISERTESKTLKDGKWKAENKTVSRPLQKTSSGFVTARTDGKEKLYFDKNKVLVQKDRTMAKERTFSEYYEYWPSGSMRSKKVVESMSEKGWESTITTTTTYDEQGQRIREESILQVPGQEPEKPTISEWSYTVNRNRVVRAEKTISKRGKEPELREKYIYTWGYTR